MGAFDERAFSVEALDEEAWSFFIDPGPGPEPDVSDLRTTRIAALYSASRIPFRPRR